jgi:excisionase family DNA binding protein
MKNEGLYTVDEVAAMFKVSKSTIRSWRHKGILPIIKVGRAVRVRLSEIERIMAKGLKVE